MKLGRERGGILASSQKKKKELERVNKSLMYMKEEKECSEFYR